MRNLRSTLTCLALGALLLTGCSSRKSQAEAAPVEKTGVIAATGVEKARETLETIRTAFQDQQMETILAEVDPRYYPDISRLRRALYEDREQISQVRLEFHRNQEIADGKRILFKLRWNRTHTLNATGASVRATGLCEMVFRMKDGKILDIRPQQGGMPIGFN